MNVTYTTLTSWGTQNTLPSVLTTSSLHFWYLSICCTVGNCRLLLLGPKACHASLRWLLAVIQLVILQWIFYRTKQLVCVCSILSVRRGTSSRLRCSAVYFCIWPIFFYLTTWPVFTNYTIGEQLNAVLLNFVWLLLATHCAKRWRVRG